MISRIVIATLLGLALMPASGAEVSNPVDENPGLTLPQNTKTFRQNRLGLSIHWGVYSVLCDGESVMKDRKIRPSDYERLPQFFNPADFDAARWVRLAKTAGIKYITFDCNGPDGFALWNSGVSNWNVTKRAPFVRDVVKELVDECHRQDMTLYLGYSPHKPSPSEVLAPSIRQTDGATTASVYMDAQITELISKYDITDGQQYDIDGMFLTGWSDVTNGAGQFQHVRDFIRSKVPAALIGSDLPGGQFRKIPGGLSALKPPANGSTAENDTTPLEVGATINNSRGYDIADHEYKSTRELVGILVRTAGLDANLSFDVGPMPNGRIQPEITDRLREVGMWLAKHGESIYSTRGGPIPPQSWGATTQRNNKIYVHVLDPDITTLSLKLPSKIRTAQYLVDERSVPFQYNDDGTLVLTFRPERKNEMDRVLVLSVKHVE